MKYEYCIVNVAGDEIHNCFEINVDKLNTMGKEGWEYVEVDPTRINIRNEVNCIFKREIK